MDAMIFGAPVAQWLQGATYQGLMHVTDWFPTILDIAGVAYHPSAAHQLDGVSHKAAMMAGASEAVRSVMLYNIDVGSDEDLAERAGASGLVLKAPQAVRNARFKLIRAYAKNPTAARYQGGRDDDSVRHGRVDDSVDYRMHNDDGDDAVEGAGGSAPNATCNQAAALGGHLDEFLFDLAADPLETTNLIDDPRYGDVKVRTL